MQLSDFSSFGLFGCKSLTLLNLMRPSGFRSSFNQTVVHHSLIYTRNNNNQRLQHGSVQPVWSYSLYRVNNPKQMGLMETLNDFYPVCPKEKNMDAHLQTSARKHSSINLRVLICFKLLQTAR